MTENKSVDTSQLLSYLRGGTTVNGFLDTAVGDSPEMVSRAVLYMLRQKYHRKNLVYTAIKLMAQKNPFYRQVGWAIVQEIQLSHLLEAVDVIQNPKTEVNNRLRQAFVYKFVHTSRTEIIRGFLFMPNKFRKTFEYFRLPKESMKGVAIVNENYLFAVGLCEATTEKLIADETEGSVAKFVKKYRIPVDKLLEFVTDETDAIKLAEQSRPDDFFHHARWFKDFLGDVKFTQLALKKARKLPNPQAFISKEAHLKETGAITDAITKELLAQREKIVQEILSKGGIKKLAFLIDTSQSMNEAKDITLKLYPVLTSMGSKVEPVIAFAGSARLVGINEVANLRPSGMTAEGTAIQLAYTQIKKMPEGERPDAIILIGDLWNTASPNINKTESLIAELDIPLIILHCGRRNMDNSNITIPHVKIPVDTFHDGLVMEIVKEFVSITKKAVEEKELTKVVTERKPIEELIGEIMLPERPPNTLKAGYTQKLLTQTIKAG